MDKVEILILRNLLYNEEYLRKVVPFIKADYFEDPHQKIVFEEVLNFVQEYNQPTTKEVLCIEVEKRTDINDTSFNEVTKLISYLEDVPTDYEWLLDTTEKWCRDRAIYLALMESIALADGKDKEKDRDAIPSILSDALAVSFDSHVGHDYLLDYEARYESYHRKEDKIEFDLEYFNKITKGGLPNKTLNIALAGTGVGKSLFMCHVAASALLGGKNVLYITLEMAEEKIAERIDANLLNVPIQEIRSHLDLILFSLITLIYVLPLGIAETALSIHIHISKQLLKNLEDWLSKQMSLSYLPHRLLAQVMVAVMLSSLILLSPLVSLLLLILCLPLFQLKILKPWDRYL